MSKKEIALLFRRLHTNTHRPGLLNDGRGVALDAIRFQWNVDRCRCRHSQAVLCGVNECFNSITWNVIRETSNGDRGRWFTSLYVITTVAWRLLLFYYCCVVVVVVAIAVIIERGDSRSIAVDWWPEIDHCALNLRERQRPLLSENHRLNFEGFC